VKAVAEAESCGEPGDSNPGGSGEIDVAKAEHLDEHEGGVPEGQARDDGVEGCGAVTL